MPTDHDTLIEIKSSTAETREDVKELRTDMREMRGDIRGLDTRMVKMEAKMPRDGSRNGTSTQMAKWADRGVKALVVVAILVLTGVLTFNWDRFERLIQVADRFIPAAEAASPDTTHPSTAARLR